MIAQQLKLRGKKSRRHVPMLEMRDQDPARFEHPNCRCVVLPAKQEAQAVVV